MRIEDLWKLNKVYKSTNEEMYEIFSRIQQENVKSDLSIDEHPEYVQKAYKNHLDAYKIYIENENNIIQKLGGKVYLLENGKALYNVQDEYEGSKLIELEIYID